MDNVANVGELVKDTVIIPYDRNRIGEYKSNVGNNKMSAADKLKKAGVEVRSGDYNSIAAFYYITKF